MVPVESGRTLERKIWHTQKINYKGLKMELFIKMWREIRRSIRAG